VEGEFKTQAGPSSTWRWFAKKVTENKFQMKFPTAKKVEELAFFNGMMMGTIPGVTFKVEPWNPNAGAKANWNQPGLGFQVSHMKKEQTRESAWLHPWLASLWRWTKSTSKNGTMLELELVAGTFPRCLQGGGTDGHAFL
jgi:hypothetical protein